MHEVLEHPNQVRMKQIKHVLVKARIQYMENGHNHTYHIANGADNLMEINGVWVKARVQYMENGHTYKHHIANGTERKKKKIHV